MVLLPSVGAIEDESVQAKRSQVTTHDERTMGMRP